MPRSASAVCSQRIYPPIQALDSPRNMIYSGSTTLVCTPMVCIVGTVIGKIKLGHILGTLIKREQKNECSETFKI